jgi:hypothetical protein
MHNKIRKINEDLVCKFCEYIESNGFESIDTSEAGEIVDMIKDLSEASYYLSQTHAMDSNWFCKNLEHMLDGFDDAEKRQLKSDVEGVFDKHGV